MTLDLPGHFYFVTGFLIYKFMFFNSHRAPCFVFLFELFLVIRVFQKFACFTLGVGFTGMKIFPALWSGFLCVARRTAGVKKAHGTRRRTWLPDCARRSGPWVAESSHGGRSHWTRMDTADQPFPGQRRLRWQHNTVISFTSVGSVAVSPPHVKLISIFLIILARGLSVLWILSKDSF